MKLERDLKRNTKNWFLFLIINVVFIQINLAQAQIEVKYVNSRFMWVKSPSMLVKARLSHPKDGLSICWIEIESIKEKFEFISRRALPYKSCLGHVIEIRKLLSTNEIVEVIGNSSSKDSKGSYSSIWELIRTPKKCIGYFGGCEDFEKIHPEWHDWKDKGIDSNIYP